MYVLRVDIKHSLGPAQGTLIYATATKDSYVILI